MATKAHHASKMWLYISIILVVILIIVVFLSLQKQIIQKVKIESTDCGEGTVMLKDKTLCWARDSAPTMNTWEDSNNYCNDLNISGLSDWRIPTIQELAKLVEVNKTGLKINDSLFPDTKLTNYWSSSEYNNNPNMHWYLHFSAGYQGFAYNHNAGYTTRCVRDVKLV